MSITIGTIPFTRSSTAAESQVARSQFLSEIAIHLRLPLPALAADFQTALSRQSRQAAARPAPPPAAPSGVLMTDTAEHHLLMLCLNHEQLGRPLSAAIPHSWIDLGHLAGVLLNRVLAEFEQNSWPGREHLVSELIRELTRRERLVLMLRYTEELTVAEIAAVLEIAATEVERMLESITERVRRRLKPTYGRAVAGMA
jgi:hypothetical protein